MDASVPMFRILRRLWETDEPGRPLIALLCSLARDPLLMATAETIIGLADGEEYQRAAMRNAVEKAVGERMNESTIDKVVRNAASSWSQSGHLVGRTFKFRRTVEPTPAVVAFALYLARARCGFPGRVYALDRLAKGAGLRRLIRARIGQATAAKKMGLLDLRMAGDVFDLSLDRLDPLLLESQGRALVGKIEQLADKYKQHIKSALAAHQSPARSGSSWWSTTRSWERSLIARKEAFAMATRDEGHEWFEVNVADSFAQWMAQEEYRDAYFESPEDLQLKLEVEFAGVRLKLPAEFALSSIVQRLTKTPSWRCSALARSSDSLVSLGC